MSSLCHRICYRWTSLRITGLVWSSRQEIKVLPTASYGIQTRFGLDARQCLLTQKPWMLKSSKSSSSASNLPPSKEDGTGQFTESSIMQNTDDNHGKSEVPSLVKDIQTVELDVAPPHSPFDEISEEAALQTETSPSFPPISFTLRDYVDQSETLTKLVLLGVDLSKLERRPNVANMLLRLDFNRDVKERLLFLKDVGVDDHLLGAFLTRNPFILTEDMENLQMRIQYLQSKKFSKEAISSMVSGAPYLLNFSVERLDNRLAFYQRELRLNVQKTRDLVTRLPKLLTGSLEPIKENLKVCRIELGFRDNEIQHMVISVPKLLLASKKKVTRTFDYLHNTMGIPHHLITKFPQVFNAKFLRIKDRHLFLEHLGRAQYDPTQPNYISLDNLVATPDEVFCVKIAKGTLLDFEAFQKTL
ncbi:transcription termination factor 3, mitochondrial [Stegostoma tigrinum]|uniref:transcription termination factor 3, mitochondrial n=1 Tax=Stegostoma tigrinum TaxID=3053191 RepID=UPI00287067A7|nr:transcription termination factor 3, mitochondrial [Stegostoma tigrinum]XP_048384817.2 transcription termination factor 3, mitochondrial [Stegostoma tigrinum]XP_048384819.2 transcription termination factor 3, mitochondrial [Stegostoma tigrinum]XP_048384820.2 transcription termination factor 3, mitochondrial [Stegostoma tigrinum]XP_048384821.2 transcription termination factor 3, mitochondrial [Stegostoma tigrinum]XP_048384822.2 transcription termination factor 3, mitochondrial [Stegostoma tig